MSKYAGKVAAVMLVFTMSPAGCGNSIKSEKSDGKSDFQGEFIISVEEALEKIEDKDVVFLDARGEKEAKKGTVEGAVPILWNDITIQEGEAGDETWCLVPDADKLEPLLRSYGIEKEQEMVILGEPEGGWGEDGRVLWELREAGCKDVKMVDGGITALKDIGAKMVKEIKEPKQSNIQITELDKSHDITTEELQANYDDYKIVDVRLPKEYEGAVLYNEAQGGHMPGAINIPYVDMFQERRNFKIK